MEERRMDCEAQELRSLSEERKALKVGSRRRLKDCELNGNEASDRLYRDASRRQGLQQRLRRVDGPKGVEPCSPEEAVASSSSRVNGAQCSARLHAEYKQRLEEQ